MSSLANAWWLDIDPWGTDRIINFWNVMGDGPIEICLKLSRKRGSSDFVFRKRRKYYRWEETVFTPLCLGLST